jgi:very-short-patch-repair endonuclease
MKRHEGTRTRARELRREMTEPERRLWQIVRAGRLGFKFQRQVVLAPYIADFAARSERLVIEIDGETHGSDIAYDARRTADLEARGYRVLRFTNADVMTNPEGVARTILMASGRDPESPLSPTLSP